MLDLIKVLDKARIKKLLPGQNIEPSQEIICNLLDLELVRDKLKHHKRTSDILDFHAEIRLEFRHHPCIYLRCQALLPSQPVANPFQQLYLLFTIHLRTY